MTLRNILFVSLFMAVSSATWAQKTIVNGVPWYDQNRNIVNSHSSCIVRDGGRYYLFGEYKSDTTNAFPGFGCYSSDDLVNWKFERVALKVQAPGSILGPNRIGERPKVMRCPKTGEYIMLMHADSINYRDQSIGIAVSDKINGEYKLLGSILFNGKPIRRWDMGTFQDTDGKGYLLIHHGPIYQLSDDYRSIVAQVANIKGMGESPAMFKKDGIYYLLTSNTTGWERNDNFYYTAPSIKGPWTKQGYFCPQGTLTYNTQCTFVLPLTISGDTIPMYMGDRWAYPHQGSAATNVWLPMQVDGAKLSIPHYMQAWNPATVKEVDVLKDARRIYGKEWQTDKKGEKLSVKFTGANVAVIGSAEKDGGFAWVSIHDDSGKKVYSSLVDFYSRVPDKSIRIITPKLPHAKYTLTVEPSGTTFRWALKSGKMTGSEGYMVRVSEVFAYK